MYGKRSFFVNLFSKKTFWIDFPFFTGLKLYRKLILLDFH
ncbi:hypothetical protein LLT7_00755 [Lactococcus cremoris subsp. cremoris TIFN7]|nr:hypothetical protein LLT7_00755 [Lactococcus cremoris subsp. cremoris TIFN7]